MDDTEFASRQSAVRHSQDLLLAGVQAAEVGISIYDADFRLQVCNPVFRDIFDLPAEMVVPGAPLAPALRLLAGRRVYGEVDSEAFVAEALAELRDMVQPLVRERRVGDGRIFLSHTSRLPDGGYITVHTDISYYKDAEASLLEMVGELETALDHLEVPLLVAGRRAGLPIRRLNPACEQLFSAPRGALRGDSLQRLFADEDAWLRFCFAAESLAASGEMPAQALRLRTVDGKVFSGSLRVVASAAGDRLIAYFSTC